MVEVVSELIVSLDMRARGQHSPGYYGYFGPESESACNRSMRSRIAP